MLTLFDEDDVAADFDPSCWHPSWMPVECSDEDLDWNDYSDEENM